MRDAVNDYLEASGANRPSIGGEETILAHRKIAANRLAIDCIYALSKEELDNAYQKLESTRIALVAAQESTDNIVGGVCNAIIKAERSNLKVGINDEGLAQLNERNDAAISAFKQALNEHEKRINALFAHQQMELKRIRNVEEGAYFNGRTYAWMFGLAFASWAIIFVEITIWICIKLF